MRSTIFLVLWLLLPVSLLSQQSDVQLAEALYQAGNYEKAAELYEKLYQRDPSSLFYVERLRECWSELRNYDKLIPLLQREILRSQVVSYTLSLKVHLAQCYYERREVDKAAKVLQSLGEGLQSQSDYAMAIQELRRARFFEPMLMWIQRARERFRNQMLFAEEAGDAQLFLSNYRAATEEYIKILEDDFPNFGKVQSQILSYANRSSPAVLREVLSTLEGMRSKFPESSLPRQLLSQLLMQLYIEADNYDGAFAEALYRDRITAARGGQLLSFANQMLQKRQLAAARKGFQAILSTNADAPFVQRAKIGLATVLEKEAETLTGTERQAKLEQAVALYQEYEQTYRMSQNLPEVYLAQANLEFRLLENPAAAERTAKKLLERFYESQPARAAELLLAKIRLAQDKFEGLQEMLKKLASSPHANAEVQAEASYYLALVQFLESDFDAALQTLSHIDIARDAANEAIELRLMLIEALSDTAKNPQAIQALKEYSIAKRAAVARKYDEASSRFAEWLSKYPTSSLADNALYERTVLLERTSLAAAAESYEQFLQVYPKSFYADKVLFRLGELYEEPLKSPAKALVCYERLLREYPRSFYLRQARERLRKLKSSS
ncbi:MAG: tetratricopeptide repeat protein [Chloroherpetonaceae bacterium]|nr:tetratricopeptide repeat protein [Chloroherpetonaceae bacterium]MCS7212135.1 tetratricopeptide repeat protein [Chloroherpetonaceae bacterium]MDW8018728.1 tetratricopeptide repeat protein [Chloroherpetonaceae bacterium]MDW8465913.1 tetratricopeptide repeat protein [Chloroherpetonaceae bacterium]